MLGKRVKSDDAIDVFQGPPSDVIDRSYTRRARARQRLKNWENETKIALETRVAKSSFLLAIASGTTSSW